MSESPPPAAGRGVADGALTVGFDLDMTLIDTTAGFAATLSALGAEYALELPIDDLTSRLGPPLDQLLAPYVAPGQMGGVVDRFRALYPDTAVTPVPALPGAAEAFAAVRRHGGRVLVVTGKFTPNARLHLDHLGLGADELVGEVWGVGKAASLLEHGAGIYVGDHVHDVEGALAAGAVSVSVLSGGCTRAELVEAGTQVVLDSLAEFPGWLEEYLRNELRNEGVLDEADTAASGSE